MSRSTARFFSASATRISYIPREQAELVETFAASRPNMECHIQDDGGHAFVNHDAPMFHTPEAAARAREPIEAFPGAYAPGLRAQLRASGSS